jgi:hypothetical protein
MKAYIILLVFIYLAYFVTRLGTGSIKRHNQRFLIISFLAIYALCALRDYSVGRDIPGYIETYEMAGNYPFMDTSWTHMELGYVSFMQVCSMIGLSSRIFLCLVYVIMLYPLYLTIKRYSQDYLLSVIIFVCFQFLSFDLSGIRQGLAISICLMSLPYANMKSKTDVLIFTTILLFAISLHRSSVIFGIVPILLKLRINFLSISASIFALAAAPSLTSFIMTLNSEKALSKYTFDDRLAMGGMLVFLFAILLFIAISYKKKKVKIADYNSKYKPFDLHQYLFLLIAGTFFTLAFNGTMLNRSTMCYTLFIAFAIPNAIKEYSLPTQTILGLLFHIIMLVFFYMFCLAPKSLDIVPYVLGTDIPFLQ